MIDLKFDKRYFLMLLLSYELFRSKLKEKSKKADMVRLKKALSLNSSFAEADFSRSFFDD